MTTRVTGGLLRGRKLRSPPGDGVRPTASRVRESLFSILGQSVGGRHVLDLFAGAGTLGIEAASRGASSVTFVERSSRHARVLRENVALLEGVSEHRVLPMDFRAALRLLRRDQACFDLVFVDPPYAGELAEAALQELCTGGQELLSETCIVAVETGRDRELPDEVQDWSCFDRRTYGQSALGLYRRSGELG